MIKLKVIKQTSKNVTFIIEKQTDEIKAYSTIFKASNGWKIKSFYPQVNDITKTFWVRGEAENLNKNKMICSINTFKEIQLAVDEYNCSLVKSLAEKPIKKPTDIIDYKEGEKYAIESNGCLDNPYMFDSFHEAKKAAITEAKSGTKNVYIYKRIAKIVVDATVVYI